ncbi:hypothetical protein BC939DRAFT_435790 [Gamsiella multidivaricata]|uniref:uncharacterized protein n=1 Tax=Gamsiella multidivaricata TaxID=101098 RepID=UPI00221FC4B3|nr:uncharacterized protein BC939DRAFT_435790 [Gamsiella multidivaricata]KAI7831623.1 hypothetical protein BC939DRAFT_435790 [Gamsiella multidivaricata]
MHPRNCTCWYDRMSVLNLRPCLFLEIVAMTKTRHQRPLRVRRLIVNSVFFVPMLFVVSIDHIDCGSIVRRKIEASNGLLFTSGLFLLPFRSIPSILLHFTPNSLTMKVDLDGRNTTVSYYVWCGWL